MAVNNSAVVGVSMVWCGFPGDRVAGPRICLACSGVTGCAQASLKPSRLAASSAAIFVGASITARNGSPMTRAYSRSVK